MIYASVSIIFSFIVQTLFISLTLFVRQRMLFITERKFLFLEPEIYDQFVNQNKKKTINEHLRDPEICYTFSSAIHVIRS